MSILSDLTECQIVFDTKSRSKTALLTQISQLFAQKVPGLNEKNLFNAYWQRESLGSTALGNGIAIPHIRHPFVKTPMLCVLRLSHPVDFSAEDNQPVDLVFALLMPDCAPEVHLTVLSELVKRLQDKDFCKQCRQANSAETLEHLLFDPHC